MDVSWSGLRGSGLVRRLGDRSGPSVTTTTPPIFEIGVVASSSARKFFWHSTLSASLSRQFGSSSPAVRGPMASAFRDSQRGTSTPSNAGLVWPGVSALFPPSPAHCNSMSSRDDINGKGKPPASPREFSFDWSRGRTNSKREPSTPFLSAWGGYGEGLPLSSRQVCCGQREFEGCRAEPEMRGYRAAPEARPHAPTRRASAPPHRRGGSTLWRCCCFQASCSCSLVLSCPSCCCDLRSSASSSP